MSSLIMNALGSILKGAGNLGDAGSDELYTGDTGGGTFDVQTYRDQVTQFQTTINNADATYLALMDALYTAPADLDTTELYNLAIEYETNRAQVKHAASAINAAASGLNALGVRFPVLSLPTTLQALPVLPVAIIAAAVAAVALAGAASTWAVAWMRKAQAQADAAIRIVDASGGNAEFVAAATGVVTAANQDTSIAGNIASAVKWIALGAAAWFAFQAFQKSRGRA